MNLKDTIKSLELPSGMSKRMDCPMCGGTNTFSVTNEGGSLRWNCFKAMCNTRGNTAITRSVAEIKGYDASIQGRFTLVSEEKEFVVPPHFTSIKSWPKAIDYVLENHCMDAYIMNLADIRLDPRLQRVVFMVYKDGKIVDAVGRALAPRLIPKWYRYGSSGYPFITGNPKPHTEVFREAGPPRTAVIVEDAASACAVSSVATGVALLGTSLQDTFIEPLKAFDTVLIALDKDASIKSIAIHRLLRYYVNCEVRLLDDDLKYYDQKRIQEILHL